MKKFISAVLISGMMSSSVLAGGFAASVSDFSGKVMVNKGDGFVPLVSGVNLNVGDKVLVGEDSFAVLAYEECAVSLSKPAIISVAKDAPCSSGVVIQPVADVPSGDYAAAGLPLPLLFIGAAGVVGGGLILTGVLKKKNNRNVPVSPETAPIVQ